MTRSMFQAINRRKFLKELGFAAGTVALSSLNWASFAQESVKLGGLFPFTGSLGSMGPAFENAARLAVDHINQAGGVLGKELELIVADTGTDPTIGQAAARKLIAQDGVVAIVGPLASDVTISVASITVPKEVVLISPASTSPAITDLEDKDFVFRTTISDTFQGIIQAKLALNLGMHTASIIYVDNSYGIGLAKAFKETFEAGVDGGEVLALVPYKEGSPSYREQLEAALRWGPELINLIAYPREGNEILKEAIEAGYSGEFLFADGLKGPTLGRGPVGVSEALEGAFGTAPGSLETEATKHFRAAYEMKYGQTPIPFLPQTYDAVIVIALAIEAAGKPSGRAIRDKLREVANPPGTEVSYGELEKAFELIRKGRDINYQGVSGPLTFDGRGDIKEGAVELWMVHKKKIRTVWLAQVGPMGL